jgi:dTDP-4-amino-4,6-dideoxy-D-glucose transaminase
MPPLEEFIPYLEEIWESKWLTNAGAFHEKLERELERYLGVRHLSLFANGTLALVTALQALRITGEVITTPYSFVATAHSLLWNNLRPVFVDIDPKTFNLDPDKLEPAISPMTTAILPVHCYGTPCDTGRIQEIADIYGLKVIYDAAHAFAVSQEEVSVASHGDLTVLSFHATKVFNTFEGGAIVSGDPRTKQRIDYLKNFGFADEVTVVAPGINGKMNEVQSAFGLLQLRYLAGAIESRRRIDERYREALSDLDGIVLPDLNVGQQPNYAYFPILIGEQYPLSRDRLYQRLRDDGILARRYFYPLISDMPMYRGLPSAAAANLPVAQRVSSQILCLPIFPALQGADQDRIIDIVRGESRCRT